MRFFRRLQHCAFSERRSERGFALLVVLWALVFISLLVTRMTSAGTAELRISGNLLVNAQARAAADGAIHDAIFRLSDPRPDRRWAPDLTLRTVQVGDSSVTLTLADEAGRVNPNLASQPLLTGLLRALGTDADAAADLAGSIGEWVGSVRRDNGVEDAAAAYRAAGLDYAPPGAPLESIDEMANVRGMTPALVNRLREHLTLFGPADPNPATADPVVLAAMTFANGGAPAVSAGNNPAGANSVQTVRIRAVAHGPGRAQLARLAVIRIGDLNAPAYSALLWRDAD